MERNNVFSKQDQKDLLAWFAEAKREMPWRESKDPYQIWLSEVMLQQTRVDQARPYFERFFKKFPTLNHLAEAKIDEVLLLWQGLGYYSRARNLQRAAQEIVRSHHGIFPNHYNDVIALQGIGPYTAAAVLSIAFNQAYAVVDGNVMRVVSRLFEISGDIRKESVKKEIHHLAEQMLDRNNPGDFNQALMELGATICTPRSPYCAGCPLQIRCRAFQNNRISLFPYKSPAKKRPHYPIAVAVIIDAEGRFLITRRPENAMLGGLWEFPGGKQEKGEKLWETATREVKEELGIDILTEKKPFISVHHGYTHFQITLYAFFSKIIKGRPEVKNGEPMKWAKIEELKNHAFPAANLKITEALKKNSETITIKIFKSKT